MPFKPISLKSMKLIKLSLGLNIHANEIKLVNGIIMVFILIIQY